MNKKIPIVCFMLIGFTLIYLISNPKEQLYEAKWNDTNTLAITIDGEISTTFPSTNTYNATVTCTIGTGSVSWNGTKWVLTTSGITKGSTKCNASFTYREPAFAETILADNEVKTPLSIPGTDVSDYTLDDVITTSLSRVESTYQKYYVTYGTGWEANGTKFNLTGTAVTAGTYANSYSNLVGKYLPDYWLGRAGSSKAATMMSTTNLSSVYYVVSATSSSFTFKPISSNKNITESLLASAEDDYGTSYYFRGAVTNNYVEFANKCWRIVRIGGDNTVKLILHNDNTANSANPCSSANNSDTAAFAHYNGSTYTSRFNENYDDNAYIGFKYGTPGSSTYEATHANTNKSTILTNLETWYNNNLKSYENFIDDNIFCTDKTNIKDENYNPFNLITKNGIDGLGYGTDYTYYGASKRLISVSGKYGAAGGTGPTLKCNGELSKITSKIGLITADELAYAGYAYMLSNSSVYLEENSAVSTWVSLSPIAFGDTPEIFSIGSRETGGTPSSNSIERGFLKDESTYYSECAIRPYISLNKSTKISNGSGTSEDPYIVSV